MQSGRSSRAAFILEGLMWNRSNARGVAAPGVARRKTVQSERFPALRNVGALVAGVFSRIRTQTETFHSLQIA